MAVITIPNLGPIGTVSSQSFEQKLLSTAIAISNQAGVGGFVSPLGGNTLAINNFRTSARVTYAGGAFGTQAEIAIYGLAQSLMNELQTLGITVNNVPQNLLTLAAGDAISGLSTVFTGEIVNAYGDYSNQPDVAIRFFCQAGAKDQVALFAATSFNGATPVQTILSSIANQAGWGFINNGVSGISLRNPYLAGDALSQVRTIADAAGINAQLLPSGNNAATGASPVGQPYVLAIWPRGGFRPAPGAGVPVISPETGMIGYPSFQANSQILVKCLFRPDIVFGGQINIQSSVFTNQSLIRLGNQSSLWTVQKIDLALDSLVPHGEWMMSIWATVSNPQFPTLAPA